MRHLARRVLAVTGLAVAAASALAACAPAAAPRHPPSSSAPTPSAQDLLDAALRDAAWQNDVTAATELVAQGADVNAKDDTAQSAYLVSTSEGYLDLLRLALANEALIDDKDSWNGTGLIRAAERGHGYIVGQLLQAGIDRDHVNRIGYQAIHEAVIFGQDSETYHLTVRALVAGGAELDRPSGTEGRTPLQMAEQQGLDGTRSILEAAADGAAPADPDTALLAAADDGDADAAMLALRAGADLEARDAELQRTPLMHAVMADRVEVAQLLVALGADPDAFDHRKDTPWVMTGVTGSVRMLEALLPGEPDLAILNRRGGTPANPAAERGHADYIDRVVQLDIDLNHVNTNGWTAIQEAVVFGGGDGNAQRIVKTLLAAGADPGIRDAQGRTALDNARRLGFGEIVAILGG
ncbi:MULTISPECIES: ankyrin repeat domain-containing protein [unclassified Microbacterium]|uniref:ankyrin repeat domain-containing protein n=1 Tax=unclassified Microbacterium TaxID=2609290 RepID=UPI0012FB0740|nr:ankyrin repeat domain-containing protein [Microbacterium sp. MAH-37]MVQ43263.1 ankyrin repeat domain-containing protein [Microbacterium sp. MAH-37]